MRLFKQKPHKPTKAAETDQPVSTTPTANPSEVKAAAEPSHKRGWAKLARFKLLIIGLLFVLAASLAAYLYSQRQNANKVVTIGDTKITKADVEAYAKQLTDYKAAYPKVVLDGQPKQIALDDLVLNAALRYEAKQAKITVPAKEITDALHQTNIKSESAAKKYLEDLRGSQSIGPQFGKMSLTRNENEIYKKKLGDKLLARKDLLIMQIYYDTPYMLAVPTSKVPGLFKDSTDRINGVFGPLLQQKASKDTIAAKADVNYSDKNYQDDQDYKIYQRQNVTSVQYLKGYLSDPKNWNDLPKNDFRGFKLPNLSYTNDKIDALKNVGDYTPVFTSRAGAQMIVRLDGKNNGAYSSWTDFLQQYKTKYVSGKKLAFLQKSLHAVLSTPNAALYGLTSIGSQHASAFVCSDHIVTFAVDAYDDATWLRINTSSSNRNIIQQYRSASTCNGSGGDAYYGTRYSAWSIFGENLGDNCWNPAPSWSVNRYMSGYTFNSMDSSDNGGHSGWPIWSSGINAAGQIHINFHYTAPPPPNPTGSMVGQRVTTGGTWMTGTGGNVTIDGAYTQTGDSFWWSGVTTGSHQLAAQSPISYGGKNYYIVGYYYCYNCTNNDPRTYGSHIVTGSNVANFNINANQNTVVWWEYAPRTGRVQGYRAIGTTGSVISSGLSSSNGTISFDGGGSIGCPEPNTATPTSYCSPYFFNGKTAGSHTVSAAPTIVSGGNTYNLTGYSMCINSTGCHGSVTSLGGGNSVTVNIPETDGSGSPNNGYVDLYWHYTQALPPAPTCLFNPNSLFINYGQSATLSWSMTNSPTSASINNGVGSVSTSNSSTNVSPTTTTTYIMTVSNAGGSNTCPVTVNVRPTCSFSPTTYSMSYGGSVNLSWTTNGATSASINQGIGAVSTGSSSTSVSPSTTTTYTMTATNGAGSNTCSATVTVQPVCLGSNSNLTTFTFTFSVNGGSAPYNWVATGNPATPNGTTNATFQAKWSSQGTYQVYVMANGQQSTTCTATVQLPPNQPYLRVVGGDVAAGSGFGATCNWAGNNAQILTYNNFSSGGDGAGTQLAAFAFSTIDQFTSATGRSSPPQPANGLSFANTTNVPWGGNFSKNWCANDYWATRSNVQSSYSTSGFTVANGASQAIYVTGNAVISGNILYNRGAWTAITDIPSFYLVVSGGNIYIDNSVSQLNGVYVALPDNSTGAGGTIYTCTNGGVLWNGTAAGQADSLHGHCNSQLTINGAFVAKQIKFQRTFGDVSNGNTAEVFNYGPELWLVNPAAGVTPQSAPTYNSITSLPPVL